MATIILDQICVELTAEQIIAAYRQLPPAEQERVRQTVDESWQERFRQLLARLEARAAELRAAGIPDITDEEIDEEIRIVRQQRRASQLAAEKLEKLVLTAAREEPGVVDYDVEIRR